jgi:uncharacterized membrane protein YfcA
VLVYFGYLQTKTRLVSWPRLSLLPTGMLCLSFLGVRTSFGADPTAFVSWLTALFIVVSVALFWPQSRDVSYSSESGLFNVPGSWVPLALMMCIFFTKYAVAVTRAVSHTSAESPTLIGVICAFLGLCSGLFLARALRVARTVRRRNME